MRDIILGIVTSVAVLIPFWFVMSSSGSRFQFVPIQLMVFQLLGVSLPEEAYFRGYLQERLGNDLRGVLAASILFAVMHLPQWAVYGDWYALLTFFPSLVMGLLYLMTSNITPSVIFHVLANILFLGFSMNQP